MIKLTHGVQLFDTRANTNKGTFDAITTSSFATHDPGSLIELGKSFFIGAEEKESSDNTIAGYTYLGQFVSHDITYTEALEKSLSEDKQCEKHYQKLTGAPRNKLSLNSLYGFTNEDVEDIEEILPEAVNKEYMFDIEAIRTPPLRDLPEIKCDIPRDKCGYPLVPDSRNDDNLILSQMHTLFMRFHNKVIEMLKAKEHLQGDTLLNKAKRIVRWHYQYIVINELLPALIDENILFSAGKHPEKRYRKRGDSPLLSDEFIFAAYRLHPIVNASYKINKKQPKSPVEDIFKFTGRNKTLKKGRNLAISWVVDWRFFFPSEGTTNKRGKIFPFIVKELSKIGEDAIKKCNNSKIDQLINDHKEISVRTLLRGLKKELPSGQELAESMGIDHSQVVKAINNDNEGKLLIELGLIDKIPLWFYILKESEIQKNSAKLGELGSTIVAETFWNILEKDPSSYIHDTEWVPELLNKDGDFKMVDLIKFAGFEEEIYRHLDTL